MNPNTMGTKNWDSSGPKTIPKNPPMIRITGRSEMPSLEVYHAWLSPAEMKKRRQPIATVLEFPEDHLDEQLGERGLRRALPPTGISYAEFFGMRALTMSHMEKMGDTTYLAQIGYRRHLNLRLRVRRETKMRKVKDGSKVRVRQV